ncbi:MAG: DHA2 family efflux MFS transporter permease subunit [Bauldia litoralis]|uniref:DHA2 family efflux MFS transporter permease subunit n=1 Tax=Bauldia litoralis TaxID=665467 RepID=UPI0032985B33
MPTDSTTRRKWWILGAMGVILGVILLDETIVGVALPTIQSDLAMTTLGSHWVVNIYMLVLAGLVAAAGKLGDMIGHKVLMIAGLLIFGLASLASGFADTGTWLIVARGVQGVGAAIIFPASLAMLMTTFPEEQRGMALGLYGGIGTVFLALGPLVGGVLTDLATWRWIFWINPPILIGVALVVQFAWSDADVEKLRERFDPIGLVLLVAGLSLTVFGIMQGPDIGWLSPVIVGSLASGLVLLAAFVAFEWRRRDSPLIEVRLFANPTFSACNLMIFNAQFSKMALFVFGALYFQQALGLTPLMAGVARLPAVAPQILTAPLAGRAADRFGARWPSIASVAMLFAGTVWVAAFTPANDYILLLPGLLLWGVSMPGLFIPPQRAILNAVKPSQQGEAGGISMSMQLLGAALGMAVSSAVYAMTRDFSAVFVANAVVVGAVLVIALLAIERRAAVQAAKA